jgi:hypothetical protein
MNVRRISIVHLLGLLLVGCAISHDVPHDKAAASIPPEQRSRLSLGRAISNEDITVDEPYEKVPKSSSDEMREWTLQGLAPVFVVLSPFLHAGHLVLTPGPHKLKIDTIGPNTLFSVTRFSCSLTLEMEAGHTYESIGGRKAAGDSRDCETIRRFRDTTPTGETRVIEVRCTVAIDQKDGARCGGSDAATALPTSAAASAPDKPR